MTSKTANDRRLNIAGTANFRDIGGYPTQQNAFIRPRRVYRSDTLADLTRQAQADLTALNLYGLVDFRHETERQRNPNRLPEGHRITVRLPGFLPGNGTAMLSDVAAGRTTPARIEQDLEDHYRLYALENIDRYASVFQLLLEAEGRPVLLHCTSGKDRTGFGIALVMRVLGCSDEVVMQDYILTNRYRRDLSFLFPNPVAAELLDALSAPRERFLRAGLKALDDAYGANLGWTSQVGLNLNDIRDLRRLLTKPAE